MQHPYWAGFISCRVDEAADLDRCQIVLEVARPVSGYCGKRRLQVVPLDQNIVRCIPKANLIISVLGI
jgi:hypothetical protein